MKIPLLFQNQYFSLTSKIQRDKTKIKLFVTSPYLYTSELTETNSVLKKHVNTIFYAKCYNENRYSFRKEVKDTEIGHLFEHVMLEILCDLKVALGVKNPSFSGFTDWNWRRDVRGTFHIEIKAGVDDEKIVMYALAKTVEIVSEIFEGADKVSEPTFSALPLLESRDKFVQTSV